MNYENIKLTFSTIYFATTRKMIVELLHDRREKNYKFDYVL